MTTKAFTSLSPWLEEAHCGIAREHGIERKPQPTVRSIKPKEARHWSDAAG